MKAATHLFFVLAAGTLLLQGCAETGATRPSAETNPAVSAPIAAPATTPAASIPQADGKPVVAADTKENFELVAAAIRQEMQPSGRFSFVSKTGRQTVESSFADMQTLFNQFGAVAKMDAPAHARLVNDQSAVNEVLARYDRNRMICRSEMPVGSHLPKRVCKTLGQIQQEKSDAQDMMRQNMMRNSSSGSH